MLKGLRGTQRGQFFYIFEAAFEYLISILVTGSFLATLTKQIGMSDSLTGILSSVISLGCLFQLLSILIRCKRVKGFVIAMSVINQMLFLMLYLIPLLNIDKQIKVVLFAAAVFLAYLIYNMAHPKKINWLMSQVDDSHRGRFTANKEVVSLIAGMAFSYGMGALSDHFAEKGQIKIAFALSAVVMFSVIILHTASMAFTPEMQAPAADKKNIMGTLRDLFKNKSVIKVTVVFVFYYISTYVAVPFYGTYQINELGISLKTVSVLTMLGSAARIVVSRLWGSYADKKGFAKMIEKCLLFYGASYIAAAFAVPANGFYMFLIYHICHSVSMGGINSALINLVFDYVSPDKRADSLAVYQATAGVVGFLATLAASPLVTIVQNNGNRIFDLPIYAQQLLSVIGLAFTLFNILFIRFAMIKKRSL